MAPNQWLALAGVGGHCSQDDAFEIPFEFESNFKFGCNEMEPTRSTRSSSRRSSILKPAKPRQPLQNLNFNSSSNESSPTTKLKRRVSFAEKKHVKEFCNSLEQGTVWDNTYEEHDLSNLKPLCAPDGKEHEVQNVREGNEFNKSCNELVYPSSEIINECSMQGSNVQFASDRSIQRDLDGEDCDLDFTNVVENIQSVLVTQKEQLPNGSSVLTYNTAEQICDSVSPTDLQSSSGIRATISVYQDPCPDVLNETSEASHPNVHDATSYQDINMDFTEVVCNVDIQGNESEETRKNTSIEFTQPVPASMDIIFNSQYSANKLNTIGTEEMGQDMSMELTVAIPPVLESAINNDNAEVAAYSVDDRTVKFNNVSMEVTSAVPTVLCNVQQRNINQVENWELNLGSSDGDCRSIIFHDTSMEMTKPVKISSRKEASCPDNAHRLSTIQKAPKRKYDVTCVDEETMEMTKAVAVNIHSVPKNQGINAMHCEVTAVDSDSGELRGGADSYKTMVNLHETTVCNDEAMEFTTAIGTFLKERTDNFQNDEPAKIMFYPQWSSNNSIPDNLRDDANSDRTRVFLNNSMTTTAVVSSLNVRGTCEEEEIDRESEINNQEFGRTVLLPNISMEITEAVTALRNRVEMENFVDLAKEESPLFENSRSRSLSRESLDHSAVPDNVLRDITDVVVPSVNSGMPSNETNCNIDNPRRFKDSCSKEPTLNEVENSVNTRASMALHGLIEQDTCASALEENNTPAACALFNSASNGDTRAANSEVIQTESLRCESSQVIATHSRRTYTLKPLSTGRSFTSSNKENEISEMNVDTSCYKTNDKENRVHILNEVDNLQDNECYREQSSMEKSITFFDNNLEELESIKPPSFMCLDDSLREDTPVNVSYHQEVNRETDCIANTVKRSENIECEGSPKFTFDYQKCNLVQSKQLNILEEDGCSSQTFLIKHTLLEGVPDSSKLRLEDQEPRNSTNAEVQVLECSSSTVNDIERFPIPGIAKDLEDIEMKDIGADNSNVEAQRMDCPSEIKNTGEGARDDKNLSSAMATESRESLEPHVLSVENNISIELDPFSKLTKELKIRAQSDEIIWDVYHENIEKRVFVIGFIACSLLVAIYLRDDCDIASVQFIKDIRIISRLADDADVLISIVHWLILEKLDAARLMDLYKTSEDVLPILDCISKEVKLAMDFMFDLKRLEDLNLMEITRDSISFVSRTKRMDIILRVTINIRPFDKIESQDISVHCLLGSVREDDIKKLITNVKRDHKFLRRFMNDVREYIYLMEESSNMIKKSY